MAFAALIRADGYRFHAGVLPFFGRLRKAGQACQARSTGRVGALKKLLSPCNNGSAKVRAPRGAAEGLGRPTGPLGGGQGGPSVAKRWRIRHKLLLGLGLVLAAFALEQAGAVWGLTSYMSTMNILDSKFAENVCAVELKRAIEALLEKPDGSLTFDDEDARLRSRIATARVKLSAYETQLNDTINRGREFNRAVDEKAHIEAMNLVFGQLDKGIAKAKEATLLVDGDTKRLGDHPNVLAPRFVSKTWQKNSAKSSASTFIDTSPTPRRITIAA